MYATRLRYAPNRAAIDEQRVSIINEKRQVVTWRFKNIYRENLKYAFKREAVG
jgi:hypothetical protein